jgi:hypothetical protein
LVRDYQPNYSKKNNQLNKTNMKPIKIMNATILLCAFLFITSLEMNAQSIKPTNGTIMYNDNMRECIVVNLDPETKTLRSAWTDYLKDNYDLKLKGNGWFSSKDILYAEDVLIDKISANRMNFYTQIIENENGSEIKLFASFGYDAFIKKEKDSVEYKSLNEMLESFLKVYLPKYYTLEINDTKKRVLDLTEEINDLNKDIISDNDKLEKLKLQIDELTKETEKNKTALEINKKKLTKREEKLVRIKNQLNKL